MVMSPGSWQTIPLSLAISKNGTRDGLDGKTAITAPSLRQLVFPPAGKTEISAALVQPLFQMACKLVKRK